MCLDKEKIKMFEYLKDRYDMNDDEVLSVLNKFLEDRFFDVLDEFKIVNK